MRRCVFNESPPPARLADDGVRAGLTRGNQFAFHINDLLEIGYAARADMLRAAHRFDKAGVIVGIQLFNRGDDFGLKVSRQGIAEPGLGRSGSAGIAI